MKIYPSFYRLEKDKEKNMNIVYFFKEETQIKQTLLQNATTKLLGF